MENRTSILIIGGGPTGLVLANLLGIKGINLVIVEKEDKIYPVPRATHLDEETLRNFQLTGLMAGLEKHIAPFGHLEVADENGKLIFAEKAVNETVLHGYKGSHFFDQVAFENILWEGLNRFPQVTVLRGYEGISFEQSDEAVEVCLRKVANGAEQKWQAKYLVACDGGKSAVRNYLGIEMDSFSQKQDWVIVDSVLKDEKDAASLPNNFRYIFERERLSIFAKGIGLNRRWEFQLNIEEDMPKDSVVLSWVEKYIALEKLNIKRVVRYTHNALVAQTWKKGNIFLAGDAAHLMPPTAGQGLCSGVRDAVNLAWKLAEGVLNEREEFLISYEAERKPHLQAILERTLFFSETFQAGSAFEKWLRKAKFHALSRFPILKNYVKDKYEVPQKLDASLLPFKSKQVGRHIPQFSTIEGDKTDDLLGYHFILIVKNNILTRTQLVELNQKGIFIFSEQNTSAQNAFDKWLYQNELDFVLIRPDKIILAAGKMPTLQEVISFFDKKNRLVLHKD